MTGYGLAPRLALLAFAALREHAALRRVFAWLPGAADLRDRLDSRWVATAGAGGEPAPRVLPERDHALAPRPPRVCVVRWSGLALDDASAAALVRGALGSEVAGALDGGAGSGRSDAALAAELAAAPDPPVLFVKAFEPPLAELVDWLGELRRARRALDWMRARETHAGAHRAVVEAFVAEHRARGEFPDECELLAPVLAGAGILYVADGARPYGPDYEAEMEILRWTGQPSMALINPIGGGAHVEEWRAALQQYFKIVRVFDAHAATFDARLDLLRAFGQLSEPWRPPPQAPVAAIGR